MNSDQELATLRHYEGIGVTDEWRVIDKWWTQAPVHRSYRAMDDGTVWVSHDGGHTWQLCEAAA